MIKKPCAKDKAMPEKQNNSFLIPNLCDLPALLMLIIVMQLLVILAMLFLSGLNFDWVQLGLFTCYVQLQALISAACLCELRLRVHHLSTSTSVVLAFILLLLIAFLMATAAYGLWLNTTYTVAEGFDFIARNVLVSAIISAVALRYLFIQQQLIAQQKAELHASLLALQARIRPHFLFNTLNSIASLISLAPEKAERMIEDLSTLIRASLRDDVETSIDEEWRLCEAYLKIEKIRLDERLQWHCDFSALNMQADIPSLSLQPLIENAIYHGIQPSLEKGDIQISGYSKGKMIEIIVENSQNQEEAAKPPAGHQMAISNIRHRITGLYGESAKLELHDKGRRFRVRLSYTLRD